MSIRKSVVFIFLLGCVGFISGILSYFPLSLLGNVLGTSTFYWWPGLVFGVAISLLFWKASTSMLVYLKLALWLAVSTTSYFAAVLVTLNLPNSFPSLQTGEFAIPLLMAGAVGSLGMLFGFRSLLLKISLSKTVVLTTLGSFLGLSFYVGDYIYSSLLTETEFNQNFLTLYVIWQTGMALAIGIATHAQQTRESQELIRGDQKYSFINKFAGIFISILILLVALVLGTRHDKFLLEAENFRLEEVKKVTIQESQKRLQIEGQEEIENFRKIPYTLYKAEYVPSGYVPSSYRVHYDFPEVTMYIKKADAKPLSLYDSQNDLYKNVWARVSQMQVADTACATFDQQSPRLPFVYEPSPCLPFLKTNKGFQLYRSDGYSYIGGKRTVSTIITVAGETALSLRIFSPLDEFTIQEVVKIVDSFAPMSTDELIAQYNIED